ncbi:hypothetical protein [Methylobacterium nigriterrae]|uniref:hypothetical protein n=1 Tax=Methylobacterium nigriterrae TaxID=3127512 RepID=UPI0030141BB7
MTSDRAITANRRNARASTGPRTMAGKARSGQNAGKHGLAATEAASDAAPEVEHFVALIAGDLGTDPAIREAARTIAETQFHLRRVLTVKHALMRDSAPNPDGEASVDASSVLATGALNLLHGLERLERYERRAFSRRKSAIRRFEQLAAHTQCRAQGRAPE